MWSPGGLRKLSPGWDGISIYISPTPRTPQSGANKQGTQWTWLQGSVDLTKFYPKEEAVYPWNWPIKWLHQLRKPTISPQTLEIINSHYKSRVTYPPSPCHSAVVWRGRIQHKIASILTCKSFPWSWKLWQMMKNSATDAIPSGPRAPCSPICHHFHNCFYFRDPHFKFKRIHFLLHKSHFG